jgi:hypothetical protein
MPPRGDLTTLPQIDDLNRREFMAGAIGTAILIACGSDDEDDQAGASDPNGGFPRTVTHALGETRIPTGPERIVALMDTEPLDCLLAVGLKPSLYGYSNAYGTGVPPWVTAAGGLEGTQSFDRPRGPSSTWSRGADRAGDRRSRPQHQGTGPERSLHADAIIQAAEGRGKKLS